MKNQIIDLAIDRLKENDKHMLDIIQVVQTTIPLLLHYKEDQDIEKSMLELNSIFDSKINELDITMTMSLDEMYSTIGTTPKETPLIGIYYMYIKQVGDLYHFVWSAVDEYKKQIENHN